MIVKIKNNTALQMFTKTDNNGKNFVWWRILIILLNVNMQLSSCKSVIWWIVSQRKIISEGGTSFRGEIIRHITFLQVDNCFITSNIFYVQQAVYFLVCLTSKPFVRRHAVV
jgi:hypothetical protein